MIAFIDDHRAFHGVEPICRLLAIAPSTYQARVACRRDPARASARARRDAELRPEIARVHAETFGVYGARTVWRQLRREGVAVARCAVERLMQAMGLRGAVRGKTVKTTIQDPAAPCPLDRVNRQFHAPAPNMPWVSDFTHVATWAGFAHTAFVIDAYARRIAGQAGEPNRHRGLRARRARAGDPPAPARKGRGTGRALGTADRNILPFGTTRASRRGRHRPLRGLDRPTATTTRWPRP
jgi:hypothetical protein